MATLHVEPWQYSPIPPGRERARARLWADASWLVGCLAFDHDAPVIAVSDLGDHRVAAVRNLESAPGRERTAIRDLGAGVCCLCCQPGVFLAISTKRDGDIVFSVDGGLAWELTDPALAEATATGVVATGPDATKAVVSNFEVIHRVPVISTTTTTDTG